MTTHRPRAGNPTLDVARVAVLVVATIGGAALAGCASLPDSAARHRAWAARAVPLLAARTDADSLWMAALLSIWTPAGRHETPDGDRWRYTSGSLELAHRAAAAAPRDPLVATVRLRLCAEVEGCDVRALAAEAREIDAGNAATWEYELRAAVTAGDEERVDAVLASMAREQRHAMHWGAAVTRGAAALAGIAPLLPHEPLAVDDVHAQLTTVGLASAVLTSQFQSLSRACRAPLERAGRRESCLAIVRQLQAGDTLPAVGFGSSLEASLWSEGSTERTAALERRRTFDWRLARLNEVVTPWWPPSQRARIREYAELRARLPREQDVVLELLRRHAVAADPPPGWTAADS